MRCAAVLLLTMAAALPAASEAASQTPDSAATTAATAGPRNCTLRVGPGGVTRREGDLLYIDDPFTVVCDDGANLRASSGIYDRAARVVTLMGDVYFDDPTRSLTSDQAVYNSVLGMLHATGNVVFTDRVEGTTLTGPELEYYRATETRPEALVNAMGRPRLTLSQRPGGTAADTTVRAPAEPVEPPDVTAADTSGMPLTIDADRMTIEGRNDLTALGNVVIQDDEMRAVADEAEQRGSSETLELRGNAEIHSQEYSLAADVIFATVPEGSIEDVEATGNARMLGEDLNVEAPRMTLFFADDLLQRSVARADEALAPGVQPLASSPTFRLQADSIDASLPGQRLEVVVAIGDARGEMIDTTRIGVVEGDSAVIALADSLGVRSDSASLAMEDAVEGRGDGAALTMSDSLGMPRDVEGDPSGGVAARFESGDSITTVSAAELVENDWITGDTITGYFTSGVVTPDDAAEGSEGAERAEADDDDEPPAGLEAGVDLAGANPAAAGQPADTTLVMERLVAVGNARSLYHVAPEQGAPPGARPGINLLSAAKIELIFADGQVQVADVTGLKRGLYLDPVAVAEEEAEEEGDATEAPEGAPAEDAAPAEAPPVEESVPGNPAPALPNGAVGPVGSTPQPPARLEENR